ncbi:MAG: hypothetical protein ACPHL6_09760, partial [Rubripirellula sp.]
MRLSLSKQTPELLIADLTDQAVRYLVVRFKQDRVQLISRGQFDVHSQDDGVGLAQQIRMLLDEQSISCNQACLLLSRPSIDTVTDSLPPAS